MEVGPDQDPSDLQRTSRHFCMSAVITLRSQTELAINTHTTVSRTQTVVSNTHIVVSNTHTMVSDIHRTIVHGQEGNDNKPPVSDVRTSAIAE